MESPPLEEPKPGSEVDLLRFNTRDAAQRHCATPAGFRVPRTGRTITSTTKHGPALQKDGDGLASRNAIRRADPELRQ